MGGREDRDRENFFFLSCVSGFQFLSVKRAAKCESDFFYEENLVVSSKRKKKNDVCVIYGVVELFIEGSEWEWSKNIKGSRM